MVVCLSIFNIRCQLWRSIQMLHFLLCREKVTGMPRIEIEFEFDMAFCFWRSFGTVCCFFHSGFTFNTLHDLLKVIVLYTSCLSVRLSVRSQFMNVGSWLYSRLGKIPERFISSRPCGMNKNNNSLFCTVELSLLGKLLFIRHSEP